ncbi:MAG TPA: tyrosine--tRNA ligase [Actinobacteria bacterium]|nr:tyrosine--tRNA ligase [Actinomycetota bacterium]
MEKNVEKQLEIILQGAQDVLLLDELRELVSESLKSQKPLIVKLGLDPTSPDIHLGHTVVLNKLRQFQDLGHRAVLIIGDYTARIGDPSGRSALRPSLSPEKIDSNAETYMQQAFKILDSSKTHVVRNSQWLEHLKFAEILNITSRFTIARMLEREDFKNRFAGNQPITIMELLYPLMQAYDSVSIRSDVELGGTDQLFNLLMGRELQKEYKQKPQIAITMPILVGTDGIQKMSKSFGNYIGVNEDPKNIFGKVMSIPDSLMIDYFRLLTRIPEKEIVKIKEDIEKDKVNPSIIKRKLARTIVTNLYNENEADNSEENFNKLFREKSVPDEIESYSINKNDLNGNSIKLVQLMTDSKLCSSNSESRRMIEQGGVKFDNKKVTDINMEISLDDIDSKIIQKGKRNFIRIKVI